MVAQVAASLLSVLNIYWKMLLHMERVWKLKLWSQPRRIAAISVAELVAAEPDERIGNSVGYTVRFNSQSPRATGGSIEFVTTGVFC